MGKIITELLLVWGALPASLGGPRQFPTSQGSTHFSHIIAAWGPCGESLVALEEPLIMSAHKASSGSPWPQLCVRLPQKALSPWQGAGGCLGHPWRPAGHSPRKANGSKTALLRHPWGVLGQSREEQKAGRGHLPQLINGGWGGHVRPSSPPQAFTILVWGQGCSLSSYPAPSHEESKKMTVPVRNLWGGVGAVVYNTYLSFYRAAFPHVGAQQLAWRCWWRFGATLLAGVGYRHV